MVAHMQDLPEMHVIDVPRRIVFLCDKKDYYYYYLLLSSYYD